MGFNNEGLEAFAARLARRGPGVVGANIGANKDAEDRIGRLRHRPAPALGPGVLLHHQHLLAQHAGPARAADQGGAGGAAGPAGAQAARQRCRPGRRAPMFLKVAPDLEDGEVEAIADTVAANGLAGVIVSNTTIIARPALASHVRRRGRRPVRRAADRGCSTQVLAPVPRRPRRGRFVLIGAGRRRLRRRRLRQDPRRGLGAVQLYSAPWSSRGRAWWSGSSATWPPTPARRRLCESVAEAVGALRLSLASWRRLFAAPLVPQR